MVISMEEAGLIGSEAFEQLADTDRRFPLSSGQRTSVRWWLV